MDVIKDAYKKAQAKAKLKIIKKKINPIEISEEILEDMLQLLELQTIMEVKKRGGEMGEVPPIMMTTMLGGLLEVVTTFVKEKVAHPDIYDLCIETIQKAKKDNT